MKFILILVVLLAGSSLLLFIYNKNPNLSKITTSNKYFSLKGNNGQDVVDDMKNDVTKINMDTTTWMKHETKIAYSNNNDRSISFIYPKELYINDFGTANGTIWLQKESFEYARSVTIEIARNQLKGEFSPWESDVIRSDLEGGKYKIRKTEKPRSKDPNTSYGVIYYIGGTEIYKDRDMAIYLSFYPIYGQISVDEENIFKNITEDIARSFTFID